GAAMKRHFLARGLDAPALALAHPPASQLACPPTSPLARLPTSQLAMRLAFALTLALAGCATGGREPHRYFVLEAPAKEAGVQSAAAATRAGAPTTLLVAPASAGGFYDTQEIVYSRSPGTRAYYQFSHWTEPPSRRLDALLLARLERGGAFRNVVSAGAGMTGDLLLTTRLDEVYHDATIPPGTARVVLTAELSDPVRRAVLARRTFTSAMPVPSHDAAGAVKGIGAALDATLDELVAWAVTESRR
ncbi:MAG: ABC-type transport auxiliary lipoprotein family protein, partial [Caldimonas sp.]